MRKLLDFEFWVASESDDQTKYTPRYISRIFMIFELWISMISKMLLVILPNDLLNSCPGLLCENFGATKPRASLLNE